MSPRTKSPSPSYCSYDDFEYADYHPGASFRSTMPGHNTNNQYYSTQQSSCSATSSGQSFSQSSSHIGKHFSTQPPPPPPPPQQCSVSPSQRDFTAATTTTTTTTATTTTTTNNWNRENPKWFSSLSLNIPRRLLSFSVVQTASLVVIYSFCVSIIMIIFCTSYLLTFYDNARRTFRTSRVWAQIKSSIKDRASMLGEDWEEFLQKYFDQSWDGVDVNRNEHLGGFNNKNRTGNNFKNSFNGGNNYNNNYNGNSYNNNNNNNNNNNSSNNNARDKEWEDWLKNTMFKFMAVVAGQEISNKFQNSIPTPFWDKPTTTPTNATTADGGGGRK